MPATVLLDLYGTLVEPDWPALLHGRTALAERAGVSAVTAHHAWDTTHGARMTGTYGSLADDLAAIFSESSADNHRAISVELLNELAHQERENWSSGVRLYPDALPAVSLLRTAGSRLAIVTNASAEAASVVDSLGLRSLVDHIFTSCETGLLKPDLLELALASLGVEPVGATLVDDDPTQLDAARRLGIGTILILRDGADASARTAAGRHRPVTDLRQVSALVSPAERARQR